jgi:phospho-N-acetylmuramoyl-pentapeptide-transferase
VIPLIVAGGVSLVLSLLGTRYLIDWLRYHRVGQPIHEDVPDGHIEKAGTPTMGGVAIVVAAVVGYGLAHIYGSVLRLFGPELPNDLVFTRSGLLVMLCIAAAGMVGALDDWIKVSYARNLGLSKKAKAGGLLVVAGGFVIALQTLTPIPTTMSFTRFNVPGWDLGTVGYSIWGVLLILGFTNAVNLTDGLDGLAAGSAIYAYIAFVVMAFWMFRNLEVYDVSHALDLAVVAVAMVGAITGFLWWNAPPAQVFMGDTGSLAIGAGLAALGLTLNVQLLVPIVGALFVFETLSVIIQVGSFRTLGRRVFRMAPVHHHFELGGWPETTVLIRFWVLALMATAVALGLFYTDWVNATEAVS